MTDKSNATGTAVFPINTELRDGTPVRIRQVQADDEHLLEIGLEHLSKQDRYFRFFRPVSKLSDKLLSEFTEIDHFNHEAIGALDISEPSGVPIGVARYIRLPEAETTAEVAVTVANSHQGKGLGTLLLASVAHRAIENDIEELVAFVLSDNHRMLQVFKELGSTTKHTADGEVDIRIPLFLEASRYPQTPVGDVFRQVSEMLATSG